MNRPDAGARDAMLEKLLNSKKYRDVCPDTLKRVCATCLEKYKKPKDAEKAAREQLHGITGAFMSPEEETRCAWGLQNLFCGPNARGDGPLASVLGAHASTRERLPIEQTDALYAHIFAASGPASRVLDLACGINPIYLGLRGIETVGVDISGAAVRLVNLCGAGMYGAPVSAVCADLLSSELPQGPFSHALMLKLLPVLDRQQPGAARALLERVPARRAVVSFPTRTLGGRNVGMEAHYAEWMRARLPESCAVIDSFTHGSELVYLLEKRWRAKRT